MLSRWLTSRLAISLLWLATALTGLAVVWSTHQTRYLVDELLRLKSEENAMLVAHGQFMLQESSLSSPVGVEILAKDQLGLKFPEYADVQVLDQ